VNEYSDHTQLPAFLTKEIQRFFQDYKVLEHKQVVVEDFIGPADAIKILQDALAMYRQLRRGELRRV
jgi:inorganic pyrophosphatase